MKKLVRWYRRRQWRKAKRILRKQAQRHADQGHMVELNTDEMNLLEYRCYPCPDQEV